MKYPTVTEHLAEGGWIEREMTPAEKLKHAETEARRLKHDVERHIRIANTECNRAEQAEADRQKYYNEASEGWSRFRQAEARLAALYEEVVVTTSRKGPYEPPEGEGWEEKTNSFVRDDFTDSITFRRLKAEARLAEVERCKDVWEGRAHSASQQLDRYKAVVEAAKIAESDISSLLQFAAPNERDRLNDLLAAVTALAEKETQS